MTSKQFITASFAILLASCAGGGSQSTKPGDEAPPARESSRPPRRPGESNTAGNRELDEAKKLAGDNNLQGAVAKTKEAIAKNPSLEEAYLLLGSTCGMIGDEKCEEEAYQSGVAALPSSFLLLNERGLLLLRREQMKEAIADLERANELAGGKEAKLMADLAYAYIFVDRLGDAEKLAMNARKVNAKSIEAAMAHGEILLRKRDGKGAIEAFEAAAALTSDEDVKRNLRRQIAQAHALAGDHGKALEHFRSLLDGEEKQDPVLHTQIAAALINLGRHPEAVKAMEEAVKLAPKDPRFLGLLMQAQEKAGDTKGAKATKKRLDALKK